MADLERIVGYRIDREISRSSITSVYQGYQESLQRKVLIKRLHPQFVSDPEIRSRFEREAHALARIKHKNIVHIYDFRADDELMLLVQEWISGGSVADFIRSHGPFSEREAVALAIDVLEGLNVAHEAKVIHRDIKPSNLMLSNVDSIKITDFGLAHFEGSPTLTQQGAIMGTPAYMPPEVVNGEPGSAKGDIYSLGVTLYELLTGNNPFQADNISQTLQRVLTVKPTKLEGVRDDTNRLLLSMMAKDPNHRPNSVSLILDQLRPLAVELGADTGWEAVQLPLPSFDRQNDNGEGDPVPVRSTTTHSIRPSRRATPSLSIVIASWAVMVLVTATVLLYTSTDILFDDAQQLDTVQTVENPGNEFQDTSFAIIEPGNGIGEIIENPRAGTEPQTPAEGQGDHVSGGTTQRDIADSGENSAGPTEADDVPVLVDLPAVIIEPVISNDSGYVMLSVQPWAHVYFNDRQVGTTPLLEPLHLPSGNTQLALINPQFPRVVREFRVPTTADTATYVVDLYNEVGVIEFINAIPWAEVSLDGEFIGNTPIGNPLLLLPGNHTLVFTHPNLREETVPFSISAGEKRRFQVNLYD